VAEHPHATPRVSAIVREFEVVDTTGYAKGVRRLAAAHRRRFGLPPADEQAFQIAERWKATVYRGRVIAVFGERDSAPGVLTITDCYAEPTRFGKMAVWGMGKWWQSLVDKGAIGELNFVVHTENEPMLRAVIAETKTKPWACIWRYRKEDG
jgi:hypothetical protein